MVLPRIMELSAFMYVDNATHRKMFSNLNYWILAKFPLTHARILAMLHAYTYMYTYAHDIVHAHMQARTDTRGIVVLAWGFIRKLASKSNLYL